MKFDSLRCFMKCAGRSDVVEHLAVAGQRPVVLAADGLGIVGCGAQSVHCRDHVVVEGHSFLALAGQSLGSVHHILQHVDGVAHGVGIGAQLGQGLGLAADAERLADGQLGGGGVGDLAHVGVDGRQQLLAGHFEHGQRLDVDDLGVVLHLDFVTALHLHLGQDAEVLHQLDVLRVNEGGQSSRGVLLVGQAAAGSFFFPLGSVAVAVEDDAAVVADGPLDQSDGGRGKVLSTLQLVGVALQLLGDGGVQDGVAVAQVLSRTGHTELELVAGEGEGRSAVAVGGILAELGQDIHAQIHLHLGGAGVRRIGCDGVNDGFQLLAHEDGDDGRGCLVGAQTVIVAGGGDGGAQQVCVLIDCLDDSGQEDQELQVLHGSVAGVQQVLVGGAHRPVVVLAAAVHALKRLLVLQADQTVLGCDLLHQLHGQQVVVDGNVGGVEDGGQLMLAGSHFVVLGLGGDAQLPQLFVQFLHEGGDFGADDAEVMLFELLALGRGSAEQGAAGQDQVLTCLVVFLLDEEVLLLRADRGGHIVHILAEQLQDTDGLIGQRVHGTQQRSLFIQRLAGVADEGGGDAEHIILDEGVAGGVPCGVAAGLAGSAQAAGGEGGSIGFAAHQLLAGELHDGSAVAHGGDEAIVLLAGDAGQRLEPVGVVGSAQLHGPALHHAGHNVGHLDVQRSTLVQGAFQALVSRARQALLHHMFVEDLAAVDFHNICCHKSYSLLDLVSFHTSQKPIHADAFSRESLLKQNDAASQEVTHSAVAVYGMIIAYRAKKGNRQN